jgi:DNA-binding IclR family transcriptional regulator
VIEFLAQAGDAQKLSTVARELGLPKSSCFTILTTLESAGYVRQEDEGDAWALTLRLYYLGMKTAEAVAAVPLAQPILERLRDTTRLTSHLGLLEGRSVRYAAKIDSSSFVQFDTNPGRPASLHMTAIARAVLANVSAETRDAMLRGYKFEGGTERAFRSRRAFEKELEGVRARGYAVEDQEEVLGVRCVAAPVIDAGDRCIGSVGVLGLVAELDDVEAIGATVAAAAAELSAKL